MTLNIKTHTAIAAALAQEPDASIEALAERASVTPADVIANLPAGQATTIGGDRFVDVMTGIAGWGEITFIVNTPDLVFEAKGAVPEGSMGRGYYNLFGKPIGGHLKADNCASIAFVSRKMFGKDTHSVQFFNADGGCMFKIYLGRDAQRALIPGQVAQFLAFRERISNPD